MTNPEEIKRTIEQAVAESIAYVRDPSCDGEHFEAIVISPRFEGMALIKQHHLVMKALKDHLAQSVHALSLKTFTPANWNNVRKDYNW